MLKFNQLPPTAETTDVDPSAIRFLAYSVEDRCIYNVAEACASMVLANTTDMEEVKAIGDKIGQAIQSSPGSRSPEADASCFVSRYDSMVSAFSKRTIR